MKKKCKSTDEKSQKLQTPKTWSGFLKDLIKNMPGTLVWGVCCIFVAIIINYMMIILMWGLFG